MQTILDRFRQRVNRIARSRKRAILVTFDVFALILAVWLAYMYRLGTTFTPNAEQILLSFAAPIVAVPIFIRMGLYRAVIRYLPQKAVWTILQAMTLAALGWMALIFLTLMYGADGVPRTVAVVYWVLGSIIMVSSRFIAKKLLLGRTSGQGAQANVLVYGAGSAGSQLASALAAEGSKLVVGFLDDNPSLRRQNVAGVRVYGIEDVDALVANYGIKEIILSMPSISARRRRDIVSELSRKPVKIRSLPAISDLVTGKYLVNQIKEIDIEDLLGRSSVPPAPDLFRYIKGKSILVTGAGGSIGSELCKLIVRWNPSRLVLLESSEFALYSIDKKLSSQDGCQIVPVLGSIGDGALVEETLRTYGTQIIFHAAAHKHVPLVEANPMEGVRNNILGTLTLANSALEQGVERFVLISSDKAVRPSNVMGATKRWSELIMRQHSLMADERGRGQTFCAVRFGNVLGSNGSIVPLFKEQISDGGPVTVTHPDMTRYFMSISEAAELILQAGAMSEGGDVFLLEMGEPVRIVDLAENMIRLAGLDVRGADSPDGDIEIIFTGVRPGEKMFEELFYDYATSFSTQHPKILRAPRRNRTAETVASALADLKAALDARDDPAIRRILFDFINESC